MRLNEAVVAVNDDDAQVMFAAYGDLATVAVPAAGVVFRIDPSVVEALYGIAYVERVVRTWTNEGTFESVTDDLARACLAGRASLHGSGTAADPYYVEIEKGGQTCL